jgi:DNA-directed RNA polymerase subunit alpha
MEHNILLPTSIEFQDTDRPNVGKVVISPCHQGYGTTLGNAFRRILLSSLPGAAVESIKITGVAHEFSTLAGTQEDVIEIILNIKQLAVRCFSDSPVMLTLRKKGKGKVTAADFDKNADVEIMNPDLHIATITDDSTIFDMEAVIGKGRGYVSVAEKDTKGLDLGTIAIDSLYTPIRDVGYDVEMTRVGDVTDYQKLTITLETNGTIAPKDAISQSAKLIMDHLSLILAAASEEAPMKVEETVAEAPAEEVVEIVESEEEDKEEKKAKKAKKKKKE